MIPRKTEPPPSLIDFKPWSRLCMSASRGRPSSMYMIEPTSSVVTSGMTTTGMSPRSQRAVCSLANQAATYPASIPPMRPPMNPESTATATAPMANPGAIPGRPASPKEM